MPITLTNPQPTVVNYVMVRALRVTIPPALAPAIAQITYQPCDANENPTGDPVEVTLAPADVVAFFTAPGGFRKAMMAALQSNQITLAGTAT